MRVSFLALSWLVHQCCCQQRAEYAVLHMPLWLAHPCQQSQLCCAAKARFKACSQECYSKQRTSSPSLMIWGQFTHTFPDISDKGQRKGRGHFSLEQATTQQTRVRVSSPAILLSRASSAVLPRQDAGLVLLSTSADEGKG